MSAARKQAPVKRAALQRAPAARLAKSAAPAGAEPAPRWRTVAAVSRAIVACEQCTRLRTYCAAVAREKRRAYRDETYWGKPVPSFGDPAARLVIVGLAPGAHGANRTGRMFTGDSSGDWLYEALHRSGFAALPTSVSRDDGQQLTDCFITAAGHCAPPDNKPLPDELERCRPYLEAELRLLTRLRVVLVLGRIGHETFLRATGLWDTLAPNARLAFAHGAEAVLPGGVVLLSSFHPSRQNTQTGRLTRPMWHAIFERARTLVER
ncbi:MAG: uracil-DNA glycosylase [Candidatus Eisenbacteria bacterium]